VSAGQGWIALAIIGLTAAIGIAACCLDRHARRNLPRRPDRVDRLIASCRDDGQQYLAWPPRPGPGQFPKTGPPPSTPVPPPPPPPARPRTLVWECGCKIRPCPADEALIDVERMARTNLEDTTP
jgi:hypothetical protein